MLTQAHQLMQQGVESGCFPGGVLLVAREEQIVHFKSYGWANLFTRMPMSTDSVFDLASLTKPLATTLAVMELVRKDRIDLDAPLKQIISRFKTTPKADLSPRQLLTHTAGIPAWRPYFKILEKVNPSCRSERLKQLLLHEPLMRGQKETHLYSDIGFMILAWMVEKITQRSMGRYVLETLYQPLDLAADFFFPSLKPLPQGTPCAATELCPRRGILLNGYVHDDNAYTNADLQGHAGLFGRVMAIYILLLELQKAYFQAKGSLFDHHLTQLFLASVDEGSRPLGFDIPSGLRPSCGQYFSNQTIGHLGFTGVSFWMDLEQSVIVILCTNRIHPSRHNNRIREFRPKLHDAVMVQLLQ